MSLFLPSLLALILSLGLSPWLVARVQRAVRRGQGGLVDVPGERSVHALPTPRVGGIVLALSLLGAGVLAAVLHGGIETELLAWLLPLLLAFVTGLLDDLYRLPAWIKALLQAATAALAVALGLRWAGAALAPWPGLTFGVATPVMTGLWIFAVMTVVNFIDGIDLITSSIVLVMLALGVGSGAGPAAGGLHLVAACSLLGVAWWNITPARLFLGDAGTHVLGFLLATLPFVHVEHPEIVAMPWVLAAAPLLPAVIDVGLGIASKVRRGVPFWKAHSDHLYQRLTRVGRSHVQVALRYSVLTTIGILLGGYVAPTFGLVICMVLVVLVLAWHVGWGMVQTRQHVGDFESS